MKINTLALSSGLFLLLLPSFQKLEAQIGQTLLFQNGIPIQKGTVYWQNGIGLFNQVQFAPSKNLSMGVGFTIPIDESFIFTFSAKYTRQLQDRNLYAGFGMFSMLDFFWEGGIIIPHLIFTAGTPQKNINFLGGVAFSPYEYSDNFSRELSSRYFLGLTTHLRGKGRVAFVIDNYIFPDFIKPDFLLISQPAARFYFKHFAFDLSLGMAIEKYSSGFSPTEVYAYPTPWVSFFVNINPKNGRVFFQKRLTDLAN